MLPYLFVVILELQPAILSTTPLSANLSAVITPTVYTLILSIGYGFLLSWKRKKTGPVRLYLSGLLLPAFVLTVIKLSQYF